MRLGVFGTGVVGRALAARLTELGHEVMVGCRDAAATLARNQPDNQGTPPFAEWRRQHPKVRLGTFAEAAGHGELLINATSGGVSLEALRLAGATRLDGKILIDVANPLDFSKGMPPTLSVCNTDSLGEQIQRAYPSLRVVKALNTTNVAVMVNPAALAGGEHTIFVCGNDGAAKTRVAELLRSLGWKDVLDVGDISAARGTEMLLPIWLRLWGALGTPMFNFKIVR